MIADDDKVTLTAHSRKRFEIPPKCKKDCKAYLRKQFFIERILEHWRIRDGRGESLYPRSSSAIKLYEKMKASEDIMGRRTVAGKRVRILWGEELSLARLLIKATVLLNTNTLSLLKSFGARGCRNCLRCTLLLVKGRNLYGLLTLRQRWANEEDRVKILSEKHCRGAAAREVTRERKIKSGYVHKGEIRSSS
uniref:Uncharacterized protein n=1 Tax=Brassica oleracea var. oleracea TaxID=109376 RepID=A0A0D3A409_BRAOL